jgi:hypothetical protein
MTVVHTPQSRCRAGIARCDITPPVGIYHRMWGAALHDRARGIHRPLTATALWLAQCSAEAPREAASVESQSETTMLVLSLDHCLLDRDEIDLIRAGVRQTTGLPPEQMQVCMTHTHAAGLMQRSRSNLPGGELIGPYLDELAARCGQIAKQAADTAQLATIVYGTGRCDLARHRDFRDPDSGHFVCGFNPDGPADDTLLVARASSDRDDRPLATIINYACHPTTLAWQNTLISPDYVGALRETVERHTRGAKCLFLQGASGDLGPRDGYVGDSFVADRNGRQVGYAALAALASIPPPATQLVYSGPVVSGAVIGTWQHQPLDAAALSALTRWQDSPVDVNLPYRPDLPTQDDTRRDLAEAQANEAAARQSGDEARLRDCRARCEQLTRQLARLAALPAGNAFPYRANLLRLGDAVWLFLPGELYHVFQTTLRNRFPRTPLVVATIANDWQPGYIPASDSYGKGIYQDRVAAVAAGSLEKLIEAVTNAVAALLRP